MKIETVQDIILNWSEFSKLDSAQAGSWVNKLIDTGLRNASTEYSAKISEKEGAVAKAQEAAVKAQSDAAKASEAAEVLAGELKSLKDKISAAEKESKFQSRMSELDAEYDMSDEDKSCVAGDIKDLHTDDAAWKGYKNKFAVLAREKSKAYKADLKAKADKEASDKLAKAGKQDKDDEAVKNAKAALDALENAKILEREKLTAGLVVQKETLVKRYKDVFSPEKLTKTK